METFWHFELFGGLTARQGDHTLTRFRTHKAGALLARLAFHMDRAHSRETLVEMLWPDADGVPGRNSLKQELASLRRRLEPPPIPSGAILVADRHHARLNPQFCTTDVSLFEQHIAHAAQGSPAHQIQNLTAAIALARGDLLPGYFEEWIVGERERLSQMLQNALRRLMGLHEEGGNLSQALECAQRLVRADPYCEESHTDLIRLYAQAGQPAAAFRQYEDLSRLLMAEFAVEPDSSTRELVARIRAGGIPRSARPARSTPTKAASPASAETPPSEAAPAVHAPRLPCQFTRFFGREPEIKRLVAMLTPVDLQERLPEGGPSGGAARLVTLTGSGGAGKTRLAIEAARRMMEQTGVAAWFVPLADVTDPGRLPAAVASAFCQEHTPGQSPVERIATFLHDRSALLILDDFEQLVNAAAAPVGAPGPDRDLGAASSRAESEAGNTDAVTFVLDLMARAPALRCLVTSRQALDCAGEHEFALRPLPTPNAGEPPDRLLDYASVQLFVDRAQTVRPDFQISARNSDVVAALCEKLEGIPLAIELAAAWARTIAPLQMLERLDRRFELLVSRRTDLPSRHRTLRAAIDGSYRLLAEPLRRFFVELSVFRGGWSLAAAETICEMPDALDGLDQLRERSLLVVEEDGDTMRYRLLDMLREYGAEQIDREQRSTLCARHARFYCRLAEQAQAEVNGPHQSMWLNRLETELENVRAALDWCAGEEGDAEVGLRLAAGMVRFWDVRGYLDEGRRRLADALAPNFPAVLSRTRANALDGAGMLAYRQGAQAEAWELSRQARAIFEALGDKEGIARTLNTLGNILTEQGNNPAAHVHYEASLRLFRELGDRWGIGAALINLGDSARVNGEYALARALCEESVAIQLEIGNRKGLAVLYYNLGLTACAQGDTLSAWGYFERHLAICRELGRKLGCAFALEGFASVSAARDEPARAARLLGAAQSLRRSLGSPLSTVQRELYDRAMEAILRSLGPDGAEREIQAGASLTLEQAMEAALDAPPTR